MWIVGVWAGAAFLGWLSTLLWFEARGDHTSRGTTVLSLIGGLLGPVSLLLLLAWSLYTLSKKLHYLRRAGTYLSRGGREVWRTWFPHTRVMDKDGVVHALDPSYRSSTTALMRRTRCHLWTMKSDEELEDGWSFSRGEQQVSCLRCLSGPR